MNHIQTLIISACILAGQAAGAATWTDIPNPTDPFTVGTSTIYFSPTAPVDVKYYDGNLTPQDAASIQSVIISQFGLSTGALGSGAVSQCDNPSSGCTNATDGTTTLGHFSNTFTSNAAFDYLAVHFGQGELLFHWASNLAAGTVFEIGGLPHGLSNYRAYSDGVNAPVPLPSAVWLLGSALTGIGVFARRKQTATA